MTLLFRRILSWLRPARPIGVAHPERLAVGMAETATRGGMR